MSDDLISRQQAIDTLENTKTAISENGERYIAKQNAIMRIDALPSAQPTFDARDTQYNLPIGTDLISRQAAIDELTKDKKALEHSINGMSGYEKGFDRLVGQRNQVAYDISAIKQLPTVKPKRGKWVEHKSTGYLMCDQCGEKTTSTVMGKPRWKFCPMCGAKMEK